MGVLISDKIDGDRADSSIERAAIKILQTKISFNFRRGRDVNASAMWKRAAHLLTAMRIFPRLRRLIF